MPYWDSYYQGNVPQQPEAEKIKEVLIRVRNLCTTIQQLDEDSDVSDFASRILTLMINKGVMNIK